MTTAAETQVRRPSAVRALSPLLLGTATASVAFWYAPNAGWARAVRTRWAVGVPVNGWAG